MKRIIFSFIFSLIGLISQSALAGTTTGIFKPNVSLSSSCTISSTDASFGNLTGAPTTYWTTGTVQTLCSKNVNYSIQLGMGNSPDVNNYRQMTGAVSGDKIKYAICKTQSNVNGTWGGTSAGCSSPWRGSLYPMNSTGTGSLQTFPFYPLTQTNFYTPDNYSDTIIATVVY